MSQSSGPPTESRPAGSWRQIFIGSRGWRAGWRLLLFYALTLALAFPGALWMRERFHLSEATPFTVELAILAELLYLGATLVAMVVMARLERRRFSDYGVPLRRAFGGRFWEGAGWGVGSIQWTATNETVAITTHAGHRTPLLWHQAASRSFTAFRMTRRGCRPIGSE